MQTWRLAQASGHHELLYGCDAQHKDERRICAPRKPDIRNRSYTTEPGRNPNNRSHNPEDSCDLRRPRLGPGQSVPERIPLSRRPQLRSAIAYISVNKPVVGQLGYQTQLHLVCSFSRSLARCSRRRVMELDRNLIVIAVIITALPIIAALAWMLTALAVGGR